MPNVLPSKYFRHVQQIHRSSGTTLSIAGCSMSRIVCTICKSQQRTRVICSCERQQRVAYLLANGHAYWQGGTWLGSLILVQSLPTAGAHTQSGPLAKSPKISISKWQCGYVKWPVPLGSLACVCSASALGGCCWLAGAGCCACCCWGWSHDCCWPEACIEFAGASSCTHRLKSACLSATASSLYEGRQFLALVATSAVDVATAQELHGTSHSLCNTVLSWHCQN